MCGLRTPSLRWLPLVALVAIAAHTCFAAVASPQKSTLSPQELFKRVSPSVFVVEALSADGSVFAVGSGVAVASNQVVTNAHVVEDAVSLRVRQGDKSWPAVVTHSDPNHDLCRLRAEGVNAPPVPVRLSSTLQVGDRVYAIGAPEGLELTLSEGLISGLREYEGFRVIQTTAPISKGSSGGGLFDARGQLVAITTFYVKEGQNLNFGLPGDWVVALDEHRVSERKETSVGSSQIQAFAWFQLGYEAGEAGAYDRAVRAYREAIGLKGDFAEAWSNLGAAYHQSRQYVQAIQAFREAIRLKPDLAKAWHNLGVAYDKTGQHAQAIEAYREAIRLKPHDAEAWYNLGIANRDSGQWTQAIQAYREAIRLKPDYAVAWNSMGFAYNISGQHTQAIQAYREAIRLKPDDAVAWSNLGAAYHESGQYAQAMQAFREAIHLKPEYAEAWYNLGIIYGIQENRSKVIEIYRQLKVLDAELADRFFEQVVLP